MVGMGENAPIGGGITSRGGDQPPMVVFNVEVGDVAAACRRVEELGGTVAMPLQETPNGLRFAYLADPDGSTFGVWTPPAN
jgi:predicted enzyme related to lactoylglutathione lyase